MAGRKEHQTLNKIDQTLESIFASQEIPKDGFMDSVMEDIEEIEHKKTTIFRIYKRQIIAVVMAICLISGSMIPINGQSLLDTVSNWVSRITVKNNNLVFTALNEDAHDEKKSKDSTSDGKKRNVKAFRTQDKKIMQDKMGVLAFDSSIIPKGYTFSFGNWILHERKGVNLPEVKEYHLTYRKTDEDQSYFMNFNIAVYRLRDEDTNNKMILEGKDDLFAKISVHGTEMIVSKNEDPNAYGLFTGYYPIGDNIKILVSIIMTGLGDDESSIEAMKPIMESILEGYDQRKEDIIANYEESNNE